MVRCCAIALGVLFIIMGWSAELLAAEKGDQGPAPAPASQTWQIGVTPSYSSGNFGTNTTSSFFYAPLSIRRLFRDGDVTLVIPFVTATSDGRTTLVGGTATRVDDNPHGGTGTGSGSTADDGGCSGKGQSGSGKNRVCGTTDRLPGQKVTTAGLGDLILKGRYYVVEEDDYMPLIAVTGRMKLPTASASQGLGTGAFDYGAGLEISKMLGDKWIAFLDGGYNIIGDPDGIDLQNQHWYDVGVGYYVTKSLLVSTYYEEYRAIARGFVNARDIFVATNYTVSSAWRLNGGVTFGLSDGAPDFAVTVGTSYRF